MSGSTRYFINNLPEKGTTLDVAVQKQKTLDIVSLVLKNFKIKPQNVDGGLYVGLSGVSYMFLHLSRLSTFENCKQEYLDLSVKYLDLPMQAALRTMNSGHITDKTGFMTGNVGVFAVAAVVFHKLDKMKEKNECLSYFIEAGQILKPLNWFRKGGDELFVGRAGFLCALSWLRKELNTEVMPDSEVFEMLNAMIESGKIYSKSVKCSIPLMYHYYGTQYLGPAHGLSGILFVMLCYPQWLDKHPEVLECIINSIDSFLQLQSASGNFPCAMDEMDSERPEEDELVHWCHGAPGVIYLLAKAYLIFNDEKYLQAALRCGEVTWKKGLLKKGPGICHGVSGSGYVFLLLYKLTKDPQQLHKAAQFMNFLDSPEFSRARRPDSPFSLFEGLAGTACFAADLTEPEKACFPFFSVD